MATTKKKKVQYRKKLAAVFVSLTILLIGSMSLFESMSIDYYSVLNALIKIGPASLIMGTLGWVMGMILDQPRRNARRAYGRSISESIMKSIAASTSSEETAKIESAAGEP